MNRGQPFVSKRTFVGKLDCLGEDFWGPCKSSEVMAGELRWSCQVSFWSSHWSRVLTWGDLSRRQVCSLPLIITVTQPPQFPGPLQFVFSTKCISEEHYFSAQGLEESARHAFHVLEVIEWKHPGQNDISYYCGVMDFRNCHERGKHHKTSSATMVVIRVSLRHSHLVKCLCYTLQLIESRCLHYVWDFRVFHFFPCSKIQNELHL